MVWYRASRESSQQDSRRARELRWGRRGVGTRVSANRFFGRITGGQSRGFNASSRAKAQGPSVGWRLALRPPELGWLWLVSGRDRSLVSLLCPRPRPPRLRWTLATAGNGCREQTDRNNGDADAPGSPGLDFTTLMPARLPRRATAMPRRAVCRAWELGNQQVVWFGRALGLGWLVPWRGAGGSCFVWTRPPCANCQANLLSGFGWSRARWRGAHQQRLSVALRDGRVRLAPLAQAAWRAVFFHVILGHPVVTFCSRPYAPLLSPSSQVLASTNLVPLPDYTNYCCLLE